MVDEALSIKDLEGYKASLARTLRSQSTKKHRNLVVPEQMSFFAICLLYSIDTQRASPMLLRVKTRCENKIDVIFFARRGRTVSHFWRLLTAWNL
jgi:hypothetical protein